MPARRTGRLWRPSSLDPPPDLPSGSLNFTVQVKASHQKGKTQYEPHKEFEIGILGTGNIGKTLVTTLSQAGHDVRVANSRGPETISAEILSSGARAVTTEEALSDVEVVILSIPLNRIPDVAPLIGRLPERTGGHRHVELLSVP